MTDEALRAELRRQPFRPFRVVLTDGTAYDLRHPDMAIVFPRVAYLAREAPPGSGRARGVDIVSLLHIVRLELLEEAPHSAEGNGDAEA